MYTLGYDIQIGDYRLGMLDKVEIVKSVEVLADTATITLPGAEYNRALEVEQKIHRGDQVVIRIGYEEEGLVEEFSGWLQRISTDGGSITLECEDDLFKMRVPVEDKEYKNIALEDLLTEVLKQVGDYEVSSAYTWRYEKFVCQTATAYDVLKKVQEESGADIWLDGNTLNIYPPATKVGENVLYDFSVNVESSDLTYRRSDDRNVQVVVKALLPDGKVKEIEVGTPGGDRIEVKSASSDEASMKQRGDTEVKRYSYDGYEGNLTTWLIPYCQPGCSAELHDGDYEYKDGKYYVVAVTTELSKDGGRRTVELGFRLS